MFEEHVTCPFTALAVVGGRSFSDSASLIREDRVFGDSGSFVDDTSGAAATHVLAVTRRYSGHHCVYAAQESNAAQHSLHKHLMPSGRQFDPQRGPDVAAARDQDSHRDPVPRLAWLAMPRSMPPKTNRWTG